MDTLKFSDYPWPETPKLDALIRNMLWYFPSLYGNRSNALEQLYVTLGGGYEWVDGELTERGATEENIEEYHKYLESLVFQDPDSLTEHEMFFLGVFEELTPENITKRVEELREDKLQRNAAKQKVRDEVEQRIKLMVVPEHSYPLSKPSRNFKIPTNATPEFVTGFVQVLTFIEQQDPEYYQKYQPIDETGEPILVYINRNNQKYAKEALEKYREEIQGDEEKTAHLENLLRIKDGLTLPEEEGDHHPYHELDRKWRASLSEETQKVLEEDGF